MNNFQVKNLTLIAKPNPPDQIVTDIAKNFKYSEIYENKKREYELKKRERLKKGSKKGNDDKEIKKNDKQSKQNKNKGKEDEDLKKGGK